MVLVSDRNVESKLSGQLLFFEQEYQDMMIMFYLIVHLYSQQSLTRLRVCPIVSKNVFFNAC